MDEARRRANAERQREHKYAFMTELKSLKAEMAPLREAIERLRRDVMSVLPARPQSKDHENG